MKFHLTEVNILHRKPILYFNQSYPVSLKNDKYVDIRLIFAVRNWSRHKICMPLVTIYNMKVWQLNDYITLSVVNFA